MGWLRNLLLGLDGEQIAVKHGRRLHEAFRERDRRHLDGEAARLQYAALHVLDALLEMRVAGVEIRPGVDDPDHGPADPILRRVSHLHQPRAMAEAAQIVRREPASAAKLTGLKAALSHGVFPP